MINKRRDGFGLDPVKGLLCVDCWEWEVEKKPPTPAEINAELLAALNLYLKLDNDRRAGCFINACHWAECHQAAMAAIAKAKGAV